MNPRDSYSDNAAELSYSVSSTTCGTKSAKGGRGVRHSSCMRYLFYSVLLHDLDGSADKRTCYRAMSTTRTARRRSALTYPPFPPALMYAQHGNIASVRDISVHALLANDDTHRVRRLTRISLNARRRRALSWINLTPSSREVRNLRGTPDAAYALARQPRFSTWFVRRRGDAPLLEEVTIGVDNIRLAQFMLNERHDMR